MQDEAFECPLCRRIAYREQETDDYVTACPYCDDTMGLNESELDPVEYKVVVKPDEVEEITRGGIILPAQAADRERFAKIRGTLVACGGNAFEDWRGRIPKIGDRICYAKYAGDRLFDENTKTWFQLINDKDITAIIRDKKRSICDV
jgi:co-chaperonin GroES (HSP10)